MISETLLHKAHEKGSDADYKAYVRQFPSILTNDFKEWVNGDGRSVYAHDRSVSDGAGIAIKPEYSGYPLTQEQHLNTHQFGLSYYNPSEWWDAKKKEMLTRWVNGISPPELPEKRTKEVYVIESAEHLNAIKEMLIPYFLSNKSKAVEVTIQTGKKRTSKQNKGMWAAVINGIVEFYTNNPEALAKDVVEYVLLHKPSNDFVHELMKGLYNNNQSTASLKVPEHCNYLECISDGFLEKYKHVITMPVNNNGLTEFENRFN